jgi:GWxTD domain-containing protein
VGRHRAGPAVPARVDRPAELLHDGAVRPARIRLLLLVCLALGPALARAAEPSREQRLSAMSEDDRSWLTDFVAPIILPEEERVFLQLTESAQREGFKEDFWRRREMPGLPLPLGPGYRDRYQGLRKILDAKFIGWKSDAGRLILRRGEPDSVFKPQCGGEEVFRDLEIWTYSALELKGHAAARHIFYRSSPNSPRRLWMIHDGNAIAFLPNTCRASFDQLSRDCSPSREDSCGRCEDRCVVYGAWVEILKRQGSPAGALAEQGELFGYPKISSEGLDRPKARWAVPGISSAKAPVVGNTTPAPTPTSIRQPTLVPTPTPSAVRQATSAPTPTPTTARQPTFVPTPTPTTVRSATSVPTPTLTAPRQLTAASSRSAEPVSTSTPVPPATSTPAAERTPAPIRPTLIPTRAPTRAPTLATAPRPTATLAPTPATTQVAGGLRKLSQKEIQDRIDTLEPGYKEFLDLARPLMTEDELSRFLQLSDHDRDSFMRDFWKRHS